MTLTIEQKLAIERGETVETMVDGIQCILMSRELYDRLREMSDYNDTPLSDSEMIGGMQQIAELAGWRDPEMDDENP